MNIDVPAVLSRFGDGVKCARALDLPYSTINGWRAMKNIKYEHRLAIFQHLRQEHEGAFDLVFPELAAIIDD